MMLLTVRVLLEAISGLGGKAEIEGFVAGY